MTNDKPTSPHIVTFHVDGEKMWAEIRTAGLVLDVRKIGRYSKTGRPVTLPNTHIPLYWDEAMSAHFQETSKNQKGH